MSKTINYSYHIEQILRSSNFGLFEYGIKEKMLFIFILLLFGDGQALNLADMNVRLTSMETKVGRLESEIKSLKLKNQDLKTKIELKEIQADVSYILMEQVKLNDRNRALQTSLKIFFVVQVICVENQLVW